LEVIGGDCINEAAAMAIMRYIEEYLFEPKASWCKHEFEKRSYSWWAANEILEGVMDHPMSPADTIIEEFIFKMSLYSCVAEDSKVSFIFSIAQDTAEDILAYLKGENVV